MKTYYNNTFTILFFVFSINILNGQVFMGDFDFNDEEQTHILVFKNGDEIYGRIISIKNTQVEFLEDEKSTLKIFELSELDKVLVERDDLDMTHPDSQETARNDEIKDHYYDLQIVKGNNRLFFSETGFTLEAGENEYSTLFGLVHTFDRGFGGLTIGGGFTNFGHIILHTKFNYIPGYVRTKFRAGFDIKAVGKPQYIENPFKNDEKELQWSGFLNVATYFSYGTPDRNVHVALNVTPVFEPFNFFNESVIKMSFGGTVRVARHWKIIYENTFGVFNLENDEEIGVFSGFGASWFNDRNVIKFGIQPSTNFSRFNFPIDQFIQNQRVPFFSYSRFL